MLDLLRKFEEDATDQVLDDKSSDEDEDDTSALVKQLEGVDLGEIILFFVIYVKPEITDYGSPFSLNPSQHAVGNPTSKKTQTVPWTLCRHVKSTGNSAVGKCCLGAGDRSALVGKT